MEIERKFLINELPDGLEKYPKRTISQGYICTDPVLRLRRSGSEYFFTFKSNGNMVREEFEYPLTQEQFDTLWKKSEGNIIEKDRYNIPLGGGLTAELDIYHGRLLGLITVEVEFISVQAAKTFEPPAWFGKDVTYDGRFSNNNLSVTIPPYFK